MPKNEELDRRLGLIKLAKVYIDIAETVAKSLYDTEEQRIDDVSKVIFLTQICMRFYLNGDRLEIIDQPERLLFLGMVKDWVIEVLERRWEFLCKLDSAIMGVDVHDW